MNKDDNHKDSNRDRVKFPKVIQLYFKKKCHYVQLTDDEFEILKVGIIDNELGNFRNHLRDEMRGIILSKNRKISKDEAVKEGNEIFVYRMDEIPSDYIYINKKVVKRYFLQTFLFLLSGAFGVIVCGFCNTILGIHNFFVLSIIAFFTGYIVPSIVLKK